MTAVPALLSLLVLAACQRPPGKTTTDLAPQGYMDGGGGVRLFYRLLGGGRDTVVVVHGGTGRSSLVADSAGLDAQRFVEDLEALRAHLGLGRLTILGHSWGAAVAALYALRFPDHVGQLIIVAGVPTTKQQLVADFKRLEAGRDSVTKRKMREWMAAQQAKVWDVDRYAGALRDRPVLLISSTTNSHHPTLTAALQRAGARGVTARTWVTDHAFSAHRIKLAHTVIEWLHQSCKL